MTRLLFLCAAAGLFLASPAPPALSAVEAPSPCARPESCLVLEDELALVPRLPLVTPELDSGLAGAAAEEPRVAEAGRIPTPATAAAPARPHSSVKILVSLPQQKIYVFKGGELVDSSPVSTGRKGYETPAGRFPILQKKVHHRSTTYDNAPMPYMQRLTWSGVALHAGHVTGRPASHGCIRLPRAFAKKLYGMTNFGTTVTITRQRPGSAEEALKLT